MVLVVVCSGKKFGFQPTVKHSDDVASCAQSLAECSMSKDLKQQNCMVHIALAMLVK